MKLADSVSIQTGDVKDQRKGIFITVQRYSVESTFQDTSSVDVELYSRVYRSKVTRVLINL